MRRLPWLRLASFGLFGLAWTSAGLAATVIPDNGPSSGGSIVSITNCVPAIGNGADITNILVGAVGTTNIIGQGTDWVSFLSPTNTAGLNDIVVQSASVGNTTIAGAYTVNPAGQIGGVIQDWSQWEEVAGLPAPRRLLASGMLNGALYAIGGWTDSAQTNVYRYDGTNWTEVAGLPAPRSGTAAGVLNGALYAIGGFDGGGPETNVYRYDGTNWTEVAGLPEARALLAAGVLNDSLYAVGGLDSSITAQTNVWRYDGTNWTEVASQPVARLLLAAGVLNGALYAIGGNDGSGGYQTNVYRYDGTNWTEMAGLPAARDGLAAGVLNGMLYAVGGRDSGGLAQTNVYQYNGTTWAEVAGLPTACEFLAAGVLNGGLYAIGGRDGSNVAQTNVYRYPRIAGIDPGVSPSSGSYTGGFAVVITGSNLGDGADITNVTLCGVPVAGIVSQSATQVVVTAGAGTPGVGDVVVNSVGYGTTIKSNGFTYNLTIGVPSFVVTNPVADALLRSRGPISVAWVGSWALGAANIELWQGTNLVRSLTNGLSAPVSNMVVAGSPDATLAGGRRLLDPRDGCRHSCRSGGIRLLPDYRQRPAVAESAPGVELVVRIARIA